MRKTEILLMLSLAVPACHSKDRNPVVVSDGEEILGLRPQRVDVDNLVAQLDTVNGDRDGIDERPDFAKPIPFLEALHPALPKLLESPSYIGKYKFIAFKKIPDSVRNDIIAVTSERSNGYALLMKAQWQQLFDSQDRGITIGMLETKPDARISGVYSDKGRMLGVDVLAAEGTITHELRHADQFDAYRPYRTGKLPGVDDECYSRLHSMFAEVDATNVELPTWLGTMNRVTFDAEWYSDRDKVLSMERDPVNYPFAQDFSTVLSYPASVSYAVTLVNSCPQPIKDFAKKVYVRMQQAQEELRPVSALVGGNRGSVFIGWKSFYAHCYFDGTAADDKTTDESCMRDKLKNERIARQFYEMLKEFDPALQQEIDTRTTDLTAIYKEAPMLEDFCREMPGFRFYVNCQNQ
jgi:hypothetical protein